MAFVPKEKGRTHIKPVEREHSGLAGDGNQPMYDMKASEELCDAGHILVFWEPAAQIVVATETYWSGSDTLTAAAPLGLLTSGVGACTGPQGFAYSLESRASP